VKIGESLILGSTLTDENMVFLKQLGVDGLTVGFLPLKKDGLGGESPLSKLREETGCYETEDLVALKEWVQSHGLKLFSIRSSPNPRWNRIILGQAGRDEQIENWIKSLSNMGRAGIPQMQYNLMITEAGYRTSAEPVGRGGTRIDRFDYEVARKAPVTRFGEISEEAMWDNFTYFLRAVIPVAAEAGVSMALHPFDPQVPSLACIARIIRSVESYDRVFKLMPARASQINFCLGCFQQMMDADGVYDTIRHFGREGRIGAVHIRGVRGTLEKFDEVWPDEGKLDMVKAVGVLKEVGFNGAIEPDHAPHPTGDTEWGHRSQAYQIGYLKGVLQGAGALD
jgi:mannonate dehydratase